MGPSHGKQHQNLDFSLNHPKFNNGKFVYDGKQRQMQIHMGIDNKEYDKWKERSKNQARSQFLLLPLSHDFSSKGLCGSTGSMSLNFNDYPYLLTQQISNRKGKKKIFEETQMWYLLLALIYAKKQMNPPFSKVGDIRPQNIFLNQKGKIKISNVNSWPHQPTNFVKSFENQRTYLAPQQLQLISTGGVQSQKNSQSQLYSIGLTLLSAATLEDFQNCYDVKKHSINLNTINQKLLELKNSKAYSDILKAVICNLCSSDQAKRITSEQLWNWISPFEHKIRDSQNFFIPTAPEKIHQQVALVRQTILQNTQVSPIRPSQPMVGLRQSTNPTGPIIGSSNEKLNFPPPIARNTLTDFNKINISGNTLSGQKSFSSSNTATKNIAPTTGPGTFTGINTYTPGFTSIPTWNAESVYIPAAKYNQFGDNLSPGQNNTSNITGNTSNSKPSESFSPNLPVRQTNTDSNSKVQ